MAQTLKSLGVDSVDNREHPAGFSYRILGGVYFRKNSFAHELIGRHFGLGAHREIETNLLLGARKEKLTRHSDEVLSPKSEFERNRLAPTIHRKFRKVVGT